MMARTAPKVVSSGNPLPAAPDGYSFCAFQNGAWVLGSIPDGGVKPIPGIRLPLHQIANVFTQLPTAAGIRFEKGI
jgi:hypothetical protein